MSMSTDSITVSFLGLFQLRDFFFFYHLQLFSCVFRCIVISDRISHIMNFILLCAKYFYICINSLGLCSGAQLNDLEADYPLHS